MKKIKIIAACIAVIFAVIIAMIFFYFDGQKAVSTKSKEIVVEVSGSASNVLDQLDKAGLIRNKTVANLYIKLYINLYNLHINQLKAQVCLFYFSSLESLLSFSNVVSAFTP